MDDQELIDKTIEFVKTELRNAEGGHDWWHIERVWKNSIAIAAFEAADLLVVQLGALLHDIADAKFHQGDDALGAKKARAFLELNSVNESIIRQVEEIINHISFKGGNFNTDYFSRELAIVQDADRLDALGAIGIARTFNYGGFKGREIYNPGIQPETGMTKEQYRNSNAPTLNHFYEKLLLLKDRMNTETGRRMAEDRHKFMELYLEQFYAEWDGAK